MIVSWWTRRRRRKLMCEPFPAEWRAVLEQNLACYQRLSDDMRRQLEARTRVFLHEKHWEGVGGLELTDEMRVTISGLACFMVLGLPEEYFSNVLSVLVYPSAYVARERHVLPSGIVIEGGQARMGEAWYRGPVILSWEDVLDGGREKTSGANLVFHEFAHQLDMQNGRTIDGTPPLPTRALADRWPVVMEAAYQQLLHECRGSGRPLLDCYGCTNRAEFFAVATEAFFCRPAALSTRHPELYDLLHAYYQQAP